MPLALACLIALASGYLLTRRIRALAEATGTLDVPNERSSHSVPTPRGGGASFVLVTLAAATYVAANAPSRQFGMYVVCALAVAAISLTDDIRPMPAGIRLLAHVGAASLFVAIAPPFDAFRFLPSAVVLGAMVLWIVSLTNIFNFMDGIDGIAACQAVITFAAMGTYAATIPDRALTAVCFIAASATVGFLGLNWPPARIFMGDVGSAFLGFSCGCLSVIRGDFCLAAVALFATWPFIFDATVTMFRRVSKGENILRSHRSHFYQRLAIEGYSHRFITISYAGAAFLSACVGLMACWKVISFWSAASVLAVLSFVLLLFVRRAESRSPVVSEGSGH